MENEILLVAESVSGEKGLPKEVIFEAIESALATATKRRYKGPSNIEVNIDKKTGERLGAVPLPGSTRYGMSSWVHEGKQYVIIQLNNGYAAMALP